MIDLSHRSELIDILKPFYKNHVVENSSRIEVYGISEEYFNFSDEIKNCSIAILPMSWNYYFAKSKHIEAFEFIQFAEANGKKVVSWTSGDFGVEIKSFRNLIVLRQNGYRSKLTFNHVGLPVFINDPIKKIHNQHDIFIRTKHEIPTIGFCGLSEGGYKRYSGDIMKILYRNLKYKIGFSRECPQALHSTTKLRNKILNKIENDPRVISNFVRRTRYRAGAKNTVDRNKTRVEYFDNINNSDYIICVRGVGNFSVRFYETLAMGRIPVFVNTDCILPLEDIIKWKDHVVWIEYNEIDKITDIILSFHNSLNREHFSDKLIRNRKLWEDYLTMKGFYYHLFNSHLLQSSESQNYFN